MADLVQKCAHLVEALNNAQPDAKVFRNHCLDISTCTNRLLPLLDAAQKQLPNLSSAPGARELFNHINFSMEEALALMRKCATMSKLDKMVDQSLSFVGEQNAKLPQLTHGLVPSVPSNLVPTKLLSGVSKAIFGEQGAPSGDTKTSLLAILDDLQKSTKQVEDFINDALSGRSPGSGSSKADENRQNLLK